jgi:DNA uptake protein ComE-like DNA-binding protein
MPPAAAKFLARGRQRITSIAIKEDAPMRLMVRTAIIALAVALAAPVAAAIPVLTGSAQAQTAIIDINTATAAQLDAVKEIGPARAAAIIKGRPYKRKDELVTRKILTQGVYDKIKDKIVAKQ